MMIVMNDRSKRHWLRMMNRRRVMMKVGMMVGMAGLQMGSVSS